MQGSSHLKMCANIRTTHQYFKLIQRAYNRQVAVQTHVFFIAVGSIGIYLVEYNDLISLLSMAADTWWKCEYDQSRLIRSTGVLVSGVSGSSDSRNRTFWHC